MTTTPAFDLVPFELTDVDELHALWIDAGVRRYLWDDEIVPRETVVGILAENEESFATHGYGLWALRSEAGELLGFAGFWHFHEPPVLELLFGVAPEHWGRGLATAAAKEVVRRGFGKLGFEAIRASTDVPNVASVRVLEKLGMRFEKQARVAGLDTLFYVLERPG